MALSGNKGDWSEIYVYLKLLSDQRLQLGDENLESIKGAIYKIVSILRTESNNSIVYDVNTKINIKINGENKHKLTVGQFAIQASKLFESIKKHKKGPLRDTSVEKFLNRIAINKLKAKSLDKRDITIVIYDEKTKLTPTLGFSIKSQLGSPSTLVNASSRTNATFEITGITLSDQEIKNINEINKYENKFEILNTKGCKIKFVKIDDATFNNNLVMIDSKFPEIVGEILLLHYSGTARKLKDIADKLMVNNPLNYDLSIGHKYYHHKIKSFLTDYALGMIASRVWNGIYDANGGYIIVKNNGELICYHFYHKNLFEEYLINNTKTETADLKRIAKAKKNHTGLIFKEENRIYFRLNLQIRFNV